MWFVYETEKDDFDIILQEGSFEMIEWIIGAVVLNGVMNSKAKKAAEVEKRKRKEEIKKLKKEIRELKGEEEEKGFLESILWG